MRADASEEIEADAGGGERDAGARARLRVDGGVRLRVRAEDGISRAATLRERDGYRLRTERRAGPAGGVEALLLNTGGGVAAGDRARLEIEAGAGARVRVSSPAAERIYGADPTADLGPARITVALRAEAEARIDWLPQETILFDRPSLERRFEIDVAPTGGALVVETLILGRAAMGETVRTARIWDRWRARRGGALAFAETVRLSGAVEAALRSRAAGGGARAFGMALLIAPDAEARLDAVRAAIGAETAPAAEQAPRMLAAASAWNGMLVVRALGDGAASMRKLWARMLPALSDAAPPRAWSS
ncbi:MAG: urease accessory protein UreD [Pseudomonadota bacterium]